jgi:hydroxyethylthiazole kinase-like uncharacterized protein yjeF
MQTIATTAQIRDAELATIASGTSVETLAQRAGWVIARTALRMLGGTYAKRVLVIAGKGNNGLDGRIAAQLLQSRGMRVKTVEAIDAAGTVISEPCDLVIDAAYGIGLSREYAAPRIEPSRSIGSTKQPKVLAVDVPSGLNADTGEIIGTALKADKTITFSAYKPGMLVGQGLRYCGEIEVADIGVDMSHLDQLVMDDAVAAKMFPERPRDAHKWSYALAVVAGSPDFMGAGELCVKSAMRAGAGMVRWIAPGIDQAEMPTGEWIGRMVPNGGWEREVVGELDRCKAVVVGPGVGRGDATQGAVRRFVAQCHLPMVIDADGLCALGGYDQAAQLLSQRDAPTIITPHDGEFERLALRPPSVDRFPDVLNLSKYFSATVVLKGPTTVVASPDGALRVTRAQDARLATAGTGDVLSGVIGALLAQGMIPREAAALGAWWHLEAAASLPFGTGLLAHDLLDALPAVRAR